MENVWAPGVYYSIKVSYVNILIPKETLRNYYYTVEQKC